jgi:hypothetical protein
VLFRSVKSASYILNRFHSIKIDEKLRGIADLSDIRGLRPHLRRRSSKRERFQTITARDK